MITVCPGVGGECHVTRSLAPAPIQVTTVRAVEVSETHAEISDQFLFSYQLVKLANMVTINTN